MDRIDHQLERGIDHRARLFGIEVLHQIHRALDVSEERGNRLAFALDIFGSRCVGYANRSIVRLLCRSRSERGAAFAAKAFARRIIGAALRTKIRQRRAAIAAEFLADRVFDPALRAAHSTLPAPQWTARVSRQPARSGKHYRHRSDSHHYIYVSCFSLPLSGCHYSLRGGGCGEESVAAPFNERRKSVRIGNRAAHQRR
jgi:hypothetical protein